MAQDVYENLSSEIKNAEKSLVNMNDFRVTFQRADGQNWDAVTGLVGQEVGASSDIQTNYKNYALNKVVRANAKIELAYIQY